MNFTRKNCLILLAVSCLAIMAACDTTLSLGSKVNTGNIHSNKDDPDLYFIQGSESEIWFDVVQDQGFDIAKVFVDVEYYVKDGGGVKSTRKADAHYDSAKGKWYAILDVSDMEDGRINPWVTAIDVTGKTSINKDIIYFVKNTPPQVEMTIPSVKGEQFDDSGPGGYLSLLYSLDPVPVGFDLMGLATDDYGIPLGWPKIMLWPEGDSNLIVPSDDPEYGMPTTALFKEWYTMIVPGSTKDGATATRAVCPMTSLVYDPGHPAAAENGYRLRRDSDPRGTPYLNGYYRFRIQTKDKFGIINEYPDRDDPDPAYSNDPSWEPAKWVRFNYLMSEVPIAKVTDVRQFYNGIGDLTADIQVSIPASKTLDTVEVFVSSNDAGTPGTTSDRYDVTSLMTPSGANIYEASITMTRDASWPDAVGNNDMFLHVSAYDGEKYSPAASRNFVYDVHAPSVKFERPFNITNITPNFFTAPGAEFNDASVDQDKGTSTSYEIYRPDSASPRWVTGIVTVGGWAVDPSSGIPSSGLAKVYYHIGNLYDDTTSATHPSRENLYKTAPWIDTGLDSYTPISGWSGNLYTWSYTSNFNGYRSLGGIQEAEDFGFTDNHISDKTNPAYLLDNTGTLGRQRFYLPFYVKVVDRAGNAKILHYKLAIDPDMDIPIVDISYPKEGDLVGGEVRLSGIATDNTWVHTVQVRIKKYAVDPSDTVKYPISKYPITEGGRRYGYYLPSGADFFYESPTPWNFPGYEGLNSPNYWGGWFEAIKIGHDMVVGWYYSINGDNGLDPEEGDQTVDVSIEVRAIDSKSGILDDATYGLGTPGGDDRSLVGPAEVVNVKFSAGVPTITLPEIFRKGINPDNPSDPDYYVDARDYFEGIRVAGQIKITTVIRDDEGFTSIRARLTGLNGGVWQDIVRGDTSTNPPVYTVTAPTGWTVTNVSGSSNPDNKPDAARPYGYKLDIPIDTLLSGVPYGFTGVLTLDLQVDDNSIPPIRTTGSYRIEVDNYYPTIDITTQPSASGEKFVVSGTAKDYNTTNMVQGLERVLVYFEEARIEYPNGTDTAAPGYTRNVNGTGVFRNPRGYLIPATFPGTVDSFYNKAVYFDPPPSGNGINWGYAGAIPAQRGIPPMETRPNVMDADKTGYNPTSTFTPNETSFANFPVLKLVHKSLLQKDVWESPHAMVIDNQEFGETTDSDEDGTFGEVWDGAVDKIWQARMNTMGFADGPLLVHYIAMDQAGNATHISRPIYIENKKPIIMSINMGTDTNRNLVSANAYRDAPTNVHTAAGYDQDANSKIEYTPAFRVRNNRLEFALNIDPATGNGDKHYKVAYVAPSARINATAMQRGSVYTITDDPYDFDWRQCGAPISMEGITFVASGSAPAGSHGTVIPYTETVFTAAMAGSFSGDTVTIPITNFGTGSGEIPDSPLSGGVVTPNDRLFIVKVYDSAVPASKFLVNGSVPATAPESDQLAHAVLVAVSIDNTDRIAPAIAAAHFGRMFPDNVNDAAKNPISVSNYNDNIVMSGDEKQGYVQYVPNPDTNPKTTAADISGKVIFRGKASDNQLIESITVQIPGYDGGAGAGTAFTVANWSGGSLVSARSAMGTTDPQQWYFKILDDHLTLDYGHAINWEFGWDSSCVTNQVGTPTVVFRVNDYRPTVTVVTDSLAVNIAPYISEVVTGLSGAYAAMPSAFARSANGWYPVRENEVITIKGFNLGTAATVLRIGGNSTAATAAAGGGTALTHNAAATPTSGNFRVVDKNQILANVGTTANSGELVVWVNNVASFNNRGRKDSNTEPYNREYNGVNNNTLTNARNLYIWTVGYLVSNSATLTSQMYNPFMRLTSDSNRLISYGYYPSSGNGRLRVNRNGTDYDAGRSNTNRLTLTTIATGYTYNSAGNPLNNPSWYAAGSDITAGNQPFIFTRSAANGTAQAVGASNANVDGQVTNIVAAIGANSTRFKIPRIAVQNTGATRTDAAADRILMSYFDDDAKEVKIIYGNIGATAYYGFPAGGNNNTAATTVADNTAASNQGRRGSIYTAVGFLSNGLPLIAWYDGTNQNLLFSYGNGTPTTNGTAATARVATTQTQWQNNSVIVQSGAGAHVDMAVDKNDNVHLAYYDARNGGLYYAYIPVSGTGAAARPTGTIRTAKVDTFLAVGTKLMINVRDEGGMQVPYISYFHGSFTETANSIRVAWRKVFDGFPNVLAGSDDKDFLTGAWEVMTVPADKIPVADEFVCNGVPLTGTFNQTGSWLSANRDITKSIVLGYMTQSYYEGAILKAEISQ